MQLTDEMSSAVELSEEAVELVEELTGVNGGEKKVVAVPKCPTCRMPGAFFRMYCNMGVKSVIELS